MNKNTLSVDVVREKLSHKNILLISEYTGQKNPITCQCHCGTVFTIKAHTIIHRSNSCGCLMYQYNKGNSNYLWKGYGEISSKLWQSVKKNADVRNITFDISIEYAWNLYLQQEEKCVYSRLTLCFPESSYSGRTASLDRIDPSKGYTEGNVQWVHKDINNMKWNLSEDQFLNYCRLIVDPKNRNGVNQSCDIFEKNHNFTGYKNISQTYWTSINKMAKDRQLELSVTIEYVWFLFLKQRGFCSLTGVPIRFGYKHKQTASLDRIDSAKGYIEGNVQWIHKDVTLSLKKT